MRTGRILGGLVAFALVLPLLASGALGESASAGEVSSSAEVSNEEPANVRVDLSGADEDPATPGVQVSPVPGRNMKVNLVAQAEDGNGWQDLRKGELQVFRPDGSPHTNLFDATPDDNGRGKRRDFRGAFELGPHDPPGEYVVRFFVKDHKEGKTTGHGVIVYLEMLAMSLDKGAIDLAQEALAPGATSHGKPAEVRIGNAGNVKLDLRVSATALKTPDGAGSIGPDRLRYSRDATMADESPLSVHGFLDDKFDLPPAQSRSAYIDLHTPTGEEQYVPAGRYAGSLTFGGVVG